MVFGKRVGFLLSLTPRQFTSILILTNQITHKKTNDGRDQMRNNGFTEDNQLSLLIWLRLVRVYENSNDLSNEFLKQFNLTVNQFDTLVQILLHQPVTQMEIAEHLTITKGGVSHMLGRLEKEGWIERKQDWKVKYITLTEKGQTLIEKVLPLQSDFQASLFDPLTDEEKKVFYSMLKKIHRHSQDENRLPRGVQ